MKYYKMLTGSEFIGAISSANFVAENPINGWLLTSNEILGQFVSYEGRLYRDYWMQPIPNSTRDFTVVNIIEIEKTEYDNLVAAIASNEEIIIEEEDDEEEPIVEEEEPDITVEYVRAAKIKEMSAACRHIIEAGFDLELRGESHHFSLDTQD